MTTKHTAGPWGIRKGFRADTLEIFQIDNNVKPPFYVSEICSVTWIDDQEANAKLIAAAPELLEALKGLHHVCEIALAGKNGEQHVYFETRLGHFVGASESMRLAESAIANATGESE